MKKTLPTFDYEQKYLTQSAAVIGVDEVGRGCLAGPVCAGAFCILPHTFSEVAVCLSGLGVRDSKMLSPSKRQHIAQELYSTTYLYAIGYGSVEEINRSGIIKATHEAMLQAVNKVIHLIPEGMNYVMLVDGYPVQGTLLKQEAIIKGDAKCYSIAAASILAKVHRDAHMEELHTRHPGYGWNVNKGYGTLLHRKAIQQYGITNQHRKLFIRNIFRAQ